MPGRSRNFVHRKFGGETGRFGSVYTSEFTDQENSCGDVVGPGDNAPFSVKKMNINGGVIEKPYTGFFSSYFTNFTCEFLQYLSYNFEHLALDTLGTVEAATRGAARTNPSRPSVDLPTELLQIHQLPDILRQAGRNEFGRVGNANVAYQFGVRPIINDIIGLGGMQKQIADRTAEIARAHRQGGIKRTVVVDASSAQERRSTFLQTSGVFLVKDVDWWTGQTVKVHSRWVPDGSYDFSHMSQNDRQYALMRHAFRALTGGTIDGATAWELIPWSWLVDYFGNVGEFFRAQRNIVGLVLNDVAVMRHTVTKVECPSHDDPYNGYTMSSFNARLETKTRVTSFVAPILSSHPFLNAGQVGILASLAATRYT